jgi:outer membrane protein assembly factor BamA
MGESRLRAGTCCAQKNGGGALPFSQRYFLGGSTSLRGWGRFEVAPLTEDGLATGGRAIFDLTSEVRMPVRGNIGADLFVDAGNVWDEATRARA